MNRYFPGKIYTGLTLKIPGYEHPYTPDFAYIDSSLNLHIDIEVDEPYVYDNGDPMHFAGAWKDSKRNDFFLDKGWIVIHARAKSRWCVGLKAVAKLLLKRALKLRKMLYC